MFLAADEEDEWPPFRKAGVFDPYTDDPRLGIQRIFLCPVSDILVIAGTAGQVIVLQMEREHRELDIRVYTAASTIVFHVIIAIVIDSMLMVAG